METLQLLNEIKEKQVEITIQQAELAYKISQLVELLTPTTVTPPPTPPQNPPGSGN